MTAPGIIGALFAYFLMVHVKRREANIMAVKYDTVSKHYIG